MKHEIIEALRAIRALEDELGTVSMTFKKLEGKKIPARVKV